MRKEESRRRAVRNRERIRLSRYDSFSSTALIAEIGDMKNRHDLCDLHEVKRGLFKVSEVHGIDVANEIIRTYGLEGYGIKLIEKEMPVRCRACGKKYMIDQDFMYYPTEVEPEQFWSLCKDCLERKREVKFDHVGKAAKVNYRRFAFFFKRKCFEKNEYEVI